MVVINDEILEIARRKLFMLSETNAKFKQYKEAMNKLASNSGNTNSGVRVKVEPEPEPKSKSSNNEIIFGNTKLIPDGCSLSCVGKSVTDILVRRPNLFTFKEACAILAHCNECDVWNNRYFYEDIIRKYGIVITGLPECADEDLLLAVFFFIEDVFGIQPKIELCARIVEESGPDMIGVIFDNIMTKKEIANKLRILQGTGIEVDTFFDVNWVIDNLCAVKKTRVETET